MIATYGDALQMRGHLRLMVQQVAIDAALSPPAALIILGTILQRLAPLA